MSLSRKARYTFQCCSVNGKRICARPLLLDIIEKLLTPQDMRSHSGKQAVVKTRHIFDGPAHCGRGDNWVLSVTLLAKMSTMQIVCHDFSGQVVRCCCTLTSRRFCLELQRKLGVDHHAEVLPHISMERWLVFIFARRPSGRQHHCSC